MTQTNDDRDELFLVRGGQGRSSEDVRDSASALIAMVALVALCGLGWGVVWLVCHMVTP